MNDSATIDLSTLEEQLRDIVKINRPAPPPPSPSPLLDYDEIIAQAQHLVAQRAKIYDVDGLGVVEHFEHVLPKSQVGRRVSSREIMGARPAAM